MKWTVIWRGQPENHLMSLWTDAAPEDRSAITSAADAIDELLQRDPESLGESRSGSRRVFFYPPLAVAFDVYQQNNTIVVVKVWRTRGQP